MIKSTTPPTLEYQKPSCPPEFRTISSKPAPPLAKVFDRSTTDTEDESTIIPSKPAPPLAKVIVKSVTQTDKENTPSPTTTMAEIAAAIDRAGHATRKPQILDNPSKELSDAFRKNLINEVGQAVHIALANELPKMVHRAVSESLNELMNKSTKPISTSLKSDGFAAIAKEPMPKATKNEKKKKQADTKKKATPKKIK